MEYGELLDILQSRFEENMQRHEGLHWEKIKEKLEGNSEKLRALSEMERTGGEPDVVGVDKETEEIKQEIMADTMNDFYASRGIPPLFKASKDARIVIVGQAPGRKAEETQLFWNDLSGDRLRDWMGISREKFYNTN